MAVKTAAGSTVAVLHTLFPLQLVLGDSKIVTRRSIVIKISRLQYVSRQCLYEIK